MNKTVTQMGHISVILPLPTVLLNVVVGWKEGWAQIPLYRSLRQPGHCVSVFSPGVGRGGTLRLPAQASLAPSGPGRQHLEIAVAWLGQSLETCILQKLLRVIVRLCSRPTRSFSS